jgi:hypothetical protein
MSRFNPTCPDSDPSERSVPADIVLKEDPENEEDEDDEEEHGDGDEDEDDDQDEGYSE